MDFLRSIKDIEKHIQELEDPLDRIYGTLLELEQNKLKLSRLSVNGKDVLATSSFLEFGKFIFDIMKENLKDFIASLPEKTTEPNINGGLSKSYIRERLRVLGELGSEMLLEDDIQVKEFFASVIVARNQRFKELLITGIGQFIMAAILFIAGTLFLYPSLSQTNHYPYSIGWI